MSQVSAYIKLYEELAKGTRVRITGVAKNTVRSKIFAVQAKLRKDAAMYDIELPCKSVAIEDDTTEAGIAERAFYVKLVDPIPRRTSGMQWEIVPAPAGGEQ